MVEQFLFELLLPQLGQLGLTLDLALVATLLVVAHTLLRLDVVVLLTEKGLVLTFLLANALKSLFVFFRGLFGLILRIQISKPLLSLGDILREDSVNIVILLLLLALEIFLPPRFQDLLQVLLLLRGQLVCILQQLHQLVIGQAQGRVLDLFCVLLLLLLAFLSLVFTVICLVHLLMRRLLRLVRVLVHLGTARRLLDLARLGDILALAFFLFERHFVDELHVVLLLELVFAFLDATLVLNHHLLKLHGGELLGSQTALSRLLVK